MRKTLRIILPFVLIGMLIMLFMGIRAQLKIKRAVKQASATLPAQPYLDIDGVGHTLQNPKKQTVFVLFFNSDCDYCQSEVRLLHENREAFRNATVYLLSTEPLVHIRAFKDKYLPGNTDFILGQIDGIASSEIFGVKSFPYTLIYDKDRRLVKTFKGIVKLEALTQHIDKE